MHENRGKWRWRLQSRGLSSKRGTARGAAAAGAAAALATALVRAAAATAGVAQGVRGWSFDIRRVRLGELGSLSALCPLLQSADAAVSGPWTTF